MGKECFKNLGWSPVSPTDAYITFSPKEAIGDLGKALNRAVGPEARDFGGWYGDRKGKGT